MKSPILFLVFNRPKQTKEVFHLIRQMKPPKLYLAADGPRKNRESDAKLCQEVRDIVSQVDWNCDVQKLFREENLGCGEAVFHAISWFFQNEEAGIIIEDDCLVDPSFFIFCDEILEKYKNDTRVMSISATNYKQDLCRTKYSYSFSRYSLMWGWATWRRAWQLHDRFMPLWPELRETKWLFEFGRRRRSFEYEWRHIFDLSHAQKIDTWDYHWIFTCWLNGGLTVVPEVNMVKNLGFSDDAAHTTDENDERANLVAQKIEMPLKHPPYLNQNYEMDRLLDREWFNINIKNYAYSNLLNLPFIPTFAKITRPFRGALKKL